MVSEIPAKLQIGPKDGISYPLSVQYCGHCSMPLEYCEYYPDYEKCKQWLERNLPSEFERLKTGAASGGNVATSGAPGEGSTPDGEGANAAGEEDTRGGAYCTWCAVGRVMDSHEYDAVPLHRHRGPSIGSERIEVPPGPVL